MGGADKSHMADWGKSLSYMLAGEASQVPGRQYTVELDMEIFETNLPTQHMWMPEGHKFKVLFSQTIKGIVTPKP